MVIGAFVLGFTCHVDGATALVYSSKHQLIISSGKRGEVCLWDARQRQMRHTFTAHENSSIKCLALDPTEDSFATGSADGDVKVSIVGIVLRWGWNWVGTCPFSITTEHW